MNALKKIFALALAAAIVAISALAAEEPETAPAVSVLDIAPAMHAADNWIAYVDTGRYGQSWDESAAYFREAMPKVQWETSLAAACDPLGVTIARKVRSANYTRVLPGAPEGEYVVIQYDTRFANRPQSIETITPMRE